jgi:hypothetical protein
MREDDRNQRHTRSAGGEGSGMNILLVFNTGGDPVAEDDL